MKTWILLPVLAVVVAVVTGGCRNGVNIVEPARPAAALDVVLDKRVILDRSLAKDLEIEYLNQAFTGNLRTVQTTVRNTTGDSIRFQYRYDWFDRDGMQIRSPASTWVVRTLLPGESASLAATAPTPRAADFRFQISAHES